MAKILKRQDLAQVKNFRATYSTTESRIAKLKKYVDEYNKLVENYAVTRKSFEDTFLDGVSALDVVIPKDGTKVTNVNSLMPNPLGIDVNGQFNLDLLKYNLEHKTDLKELPNLQSVESEVEVNVNQSVAVESPVQEEKQEEEEF